MTPPLALIAAFELDQRRRNLSPVTITRRTKVLLRLHAHADLATVTGDEVGRWLDTLNHRRLAASSRRAYMADLRAFYGWARRRGHLEHDPFDQLEPPRVPRGVPRPIPSGELLVALAGSKPRMRCWLLLGALAGLRAKEIAGLAAEHLMWHLDPPRLLVADGKGGHARTLPIAEQLEQALRLADLPRVGYLFTKRDSALPVSPAYVSHAIAKHLHAHASRASAHRLRHHFGTAAYQETRDIRAVQELMGHQSPTTTSVYAQFAVGPAEAAIRSLRV